MTEPWWRDAVVYQVYPRSFQDSDGDGVGDLPGITSRLDHLVELGVDALWLSPIYPSPLADLGYDVSDFTAVDPAFGTLADFDRLVEAAHARGLKLLMDLVPCHTSIEHPWFSEHLDRYIWADGRDDAPPNNWRSVFGGSAWTYHDRSGRYYLHSFYPEQPDLDWRNPEVVEAMQGVIRFWLDRGVDGFRLDAIERLLKDVELRDDPPAVAPFALPLNTELAALEPRHSSNQPDIRAALEAIRAAAGEALLVGEVYLPAADAARFLDFLDLAFAFELFHAAWDAERLREAIHASATVNGARSDAGPAWVLSNHDFPRLPTRFGRHSVRAAAMLLLTLPGPAFVYQGDEIGLADGPGANPPRDRAGRDGHRHPMQWDGSANGGFTDAPARPWLPAVDPRERNVATQRGDPGSLFNLYRRLIALRPRLGRGLELLADTAPGVLAYRRGEDHVVALNTTPEPRSLPAAGETVLASTSDARAGRTLSPHASVILRGA